MVPNDYYPIRLDARWAGGRGCKLGELGKSWWGQEPGGPPGAAIDIFYELIQRFDTPAPNIL